MNPTLSDTPRSLPCPPADRRCGGERGEGVISTAIAVLIIAFLGVAMWAGFQTIFQDATDTTTEQVNLIGK